MATPTVARLRHWASSVAAIVGFGAIALGLVASLLGLWWDYHPESRPDPRTTISGDLAFFATEPGVALDDYLHRIRPRVPDYVEMRGTYLEAAGMRADDYRGPSARSYLGIHGTVFFVRTTLEGFKGRRLDLRWSVYRTRTKRRVAEANLSDQMAGQILDLRSPSTRQVAQLWVPPVFGAGRYFVRLELLDRDGTALAVADSASFRGVTG
jgi:hypothetical protein